MREKLKDLKVKEKLQKSYFTILGAFILTLVLAIVGLFAINAKLKSFYEESYRNTELQLEIRKDIQVVGKNVLWAVTMEDEKKAQEKIDVAASYAENVATNVEALEENYSNKDMSAKLAEALEELKVARADVVGMVTEGKNDEALELFNAEYTQATDNIQEILSEIGTHSDEQAIEAYKAASLTGIIVIIIMIIVGILSIGLCVTYSKVISDLLIEPILEL